MPREPSRSPRSHVTLPLTTIIHDVNVDNASDSSHDGDKLDEFDVHLMPAPSGSQSTDYFSHDDPAFLEALEHAILPGELGAPSDDNDLSPPPCLYPPNQLALKRDRSPDSQASQENRKRPREDDDEDIYGVAHFGDFGEYMQRKRAKLQIQNSTLESAGTGLFSGLAIYINGWTSPSVQVLRELTVSHGGVFQPYLADKGLVTHILTCSLTPAKIREFQHMKVVRPEWIVDSAAQGVLLPWQDFIYTPPDRTDATQGQKARPESSLYTPTLPSTKPSDAPAGHRTPPFRPTAGAVKRFSRPATPLPPPPSSSAIDQNPPPPPEPTRFTLPAYSQLDQSVYQALPSDVRQELDQEYKKRSESLYINGRRRRCPINPHMTRNHRSRSSANNVFPARVNVKRITNQLAPSRTGKKKVNFFGKQRGQGVTARLRMSDEDLRKLDLDPEVFWMLPTSIQREQLTRARLLKSEGGIPEVTGEWLAIRPRARLYSLDGITRRPPPRAIYPVPVVLRQRGKEKGEKLAFTETDDVQRLTGEWMERFTRVAPNGEDVRFFERFLVGCVNTDGGVGVERAAAVVKWWLVLLRRNWREYEHVDVDVDVAEGDEEAMRKKVVGDAWWRAFREVKMSIDVAARIKMGFRLSLK